MRDTTDERGQKATARGYCGCVVLSRFGPTGRENRGRYRFLMQVSKWSSTTDWDMRVSEVKVA